MARIVAKRVWCGNLIVMAHQVETSRFGAFNKLGEIADFPGVIVTRGDNAEGELWFEIEDENGDPISDLVCFPKILAKKILLMTGMEEEWVDVLMSDSFAKLYLNAVRRGEDVSSL